MAVGYIMLLNYTVEGRSEWSSEFICTRALWGRCDSCTGVTEDVVSIVCSYAL